MARESSDQPIDAFRFSESLAAHILMTKEGTHQPIDAFRFTESLGAYILYWWLEKALIRVYEMCRLNILWLHVS